MSTLPSLLFFGFPLSILFHIQVLRRKKIIPKKKDRKEIEKRIERE
jgi:hypothetical protein